MEKYERINEADLVKNFERVKLIFLSERKPEPKIYEYIVDIPKDLREKILAQLRYNYPHLKNEDFDIGKIHARVFDYNIKEEDK